MSLIRHFTLLAQYNQDMNARVYQAAAKLSDAELLADRGAFFKSVLGTLNHIVVGDKVWLRRFSDHPQGLASLAGMSGMKYPAALDEMLEHQLAKLRIRRVELDDMILAFADELTEPLLQTPLSYHDTRGNPYTRNFGQLIQHFFNHQTHHRGQVSTLLHQSGIDIGVTDFLDHIPVEAS